MKGDSFESALVIRIDTQVAQLQFVRKIDSTVGKLVVLNLALI